MFYDELLDLDRFPENARREELVNYIVEKYRGFSFDAILTDGTRALKFATERVSARFPGVPIVAAGRDLLSPRRRPGARRAGHHCCGVSSMNDRFFFSSVGGEAKSSGMSPVSALTNWRIAGLIVSSSSFRVLIVIGLPM